MKLVAPIVGLVAGILLILPAERANAQPEDCEAARCVIQAAIDEECPCAEAKNHGRYTSCVARVVNRSARQGLIPKKCRNKINGCAIRSTCGKSEEHVLCDFPGDGVGGRCRPLSSEALCTKRGGEVVASCCETCGAPEPTVTATPGGPEPTTTPIGPVETATATPGEPGATATETPAGPVATATASPVETVTPGPEATPTATEGAGETATPVGPIATPTATEETSAPTPTATEETAAPTPTVTEGPVTTATATEETAAPTPSPTATEAVPVETATGSPVATATPSPEATAGALCSNGSLETGEDCDPPGQASCPNAGNGLEICTTACQCECPSRLSFSGDAADPASLLDTGWTGISHRAPVISNGDVTVNVVCTAEGRPCGTCDVTGPVANTLTNQLQNRRCTNDTSIQCTDNSGCTGGTCEFFFGSNLPLAAGGVGTCIVNQFNGPITGTANIESGEAATFALLTSRVYTGPTDNPCPRCSDNGTINDGVQGGTCDSGPRAGLACDANGFVPGRPDFGLTSLDCPPPPGNLAATLPIDLSNSTDLVSKTLSSASPNCGDGSGEKCLCDTCNNAAQTPCESNADCTEVGATVCGGRRCLGGSNDGGPCNNNTACPGGGLCGRPGEPSKPTACLDDTSTPGQVDCNDPDGDGEGECSSGPVTKTCSVASGHGQRACGTDADCGGGAGTCVAANRPCFLTGGTILVGTGTLTAQGVEDPPVNDVSHPTLAAVFCVGPTTAGAVNAVAGLPGPGRVTIRGTALGLPAATP